MYIVPFLILGASIGIFASAIRWAKNSEKKRFNNGICPKCGTNLKLSVNMIDSQGGRGWTCPKCYYNVWVSYNVDYEYLNKQK